MRLISLETGPRPDMTCPGWKKKKKKKRKEVKSCRSRDPADIIRRHAVCHDQPPQTPRQRRRKCPRILLFSVFFFFFFFFSSCSCSSSVGHWRRSLGAKAKSQEDRLIWSWCDCFPSVASSASASAAAGLLNY